MNTSKLWLAAAMGVALAGAAGAAPYPHGPVSATDIGPASAFAENSQVTVTVALTLRNPEQLDKLVEQVYTKGSPQYRQFITPEQFQAQFGPSAETIAAVSKEFEAQGLKVTQSSTAHLHVSGSATQIEKAFAVQLHTYAVAATARTPEYRYRAPLSAPHLPAAIAGSVRAVMGLDNRPRLSPHLRHPMTPTVRQANTSNSTNTTDPPGEWTVQDYAEYYDVNPLYKQGITGQGRIIGILTLASFTPSDAYAYWSDLGLSVNPNRIKEVQVDGGAGPPSDDSGSDETTLDVEQSGGLAPGAKIIVYEAPNTDQGFVDGFALAIDANHADTLSTSWGEWEAFDTNNPTVGNGPVTDPVTGNQTSILQAYDDMLAQAALQGQTWFAAQGDAGAYDSDDSLPIVPSPGMPDTFNPVLSVDSPGAQRYMTSSGGTTLPGTQLYTGPTGGTISITVKEEQAWGWDYLAPLCNAFGQDPIACGTYSVGGGGGVSLYTERPFYQWFTPGMVDTVRRQTLFQLTPAPAQLLYRLPAGFPGRNVPDISTNADPQTGYIFVYTSSVQGFGVYQAGGTSFVAPEMNGVANLFVEALHHRIGLLNPAIYLIAATGGYRGHHAALRDITAGDNWYWRGTPGYDQASGVGVWDVAGFLEALSQLEP
jgi:kumamolisin